MHLLFVFFARADARLPSAGSFSNALCLHSRRAVMQQAAGTVAAFLLAVGVVRRLASSPQDESDDWWWDGQLWRPGDDGEDCGLFKKRCSCCLCCRWLDGRRWKHVVRW